MINYSPHTGKIVILEEDGWSSVLQVIVIMQQCSILIEECCKDKLLNDTNVTLFALKSLARKKSHFFFIFVVVRSNQMDVGYRVRSRL